MKRLTTFLMALLLTWIGASAQTDFSWAFNTGTWTGNTGTYDGGMEHYQDGNSGGACTSGKILYQNIEGLPTGEYTLMFDAVANMAWNDYAYGSNIAQVYATANGTTQTKAVDVNAQTSCTLSDYSHTFTVTVGSDGTLEYGLQNIATGGNWYIAQGVSLTYSGTYVPTVGDKVYGCTAEIDHWTQTYTGSGTNGTYAYNDWSTEADASGMVTPFLQTWVYQDVLSDQTIDHDQLAGLTEGWYLVTVDARIFCESGEAISGTATLTANDDFIYLINDGSDGSYNGEAEEYGTYTVQCYVDETGTLDIGFTIADANFNWLAWKNLSVVYLGETVEYNVGEATASTTNVRPGQTVTLTFADCTKGDDDATLGVSSSANVMFGSTAVTLTAKGTITFTFDVPEDVEEGEYTLNIPANTIVWTQNGETKAGNAAQTITFTVTVPVIADQSGVYLYNTHADQFLSRGGESTDVLSTWGELAATDVYGVPMDITIGNDGFATIKFLDSNLYLYGGGWAWTDAVEANAGKYAVKELTVDGETVYQFCYDDMEDTYLYVNDESHNYVASNGNLNSDNNLQGDITRTYWQIYTMEQRDAHKAARELNDHIAIADAAGAAVTTEEAFQSYLAGLTETDMTSMVVDAALAGSINGWTEEDYNSENSLFATNEYGTEIYQGDAKLSQTIEGLQEGIYKVTLQGFVRQGDGSFIMSTGLNEYDLSIGFVEANGYQTNLQPWATECSWDSNTNSYVPNVMGNAFTDGRTYANELYTYVAEDGTLEISINCPDALGAGWMMVKNLTLTQYVGETVTWEMTDAGWGTLILPFDADIPTDEEGVAVLTLYAGEQLSIGELDDDDNTTLTLGTASETIAANTPYLVSGTADTYTFTGTVVDATNGLTEGLLTGTFETLDYEALATIEATSGTVYLLQNHQTTDTDYVEGEGTGIGFYPVDTNSANTGVTLDPYHCYLTYSSPSGVRSYIGFPDSGEETGIVAVEGDVIANDAIYDLSGRRVAKAVKGVYIQNGKKVLVK